MDELTACPICEAEIDADEPTPGDDGVTEADLRQTCAVCGFTYAQVWAGATGKSEAAILAEYDKIRGAFGSDSGRSIHKEEANG